MATAKRLLIGQNNDVTLTTALVSSRAIPLSRNPKQETEKVYLNGLLLKNDCYNIAGTVLNLDSGLDIKVGDELLIRYLA